jgi:hypothetical protein
MNDFNFHGLPPRLNQAFDANKSSGASLWNNPITRRSFLKRSGAATVGMICLQTTYMANTAQAEEANTSASFSYEWGLICALDPGGAHDPEEDNAEGHNNLDDDRTWWRRNKATWGSDNAVLIEIKGTGPVAGRLIMPGNLPDIRKKFDASGYIKASISNDVNDGDNIWEGRFYDDPNENDNVDDDEMAYESANLGKSRIQINSEGVVTCHHNPPLLIKFAQVCNGPWTEQREWDSGTGLGWGANEWSAYKLVGAGMITPAIQVLGCAGLVSIDNTSSSFTIGTPPVAPFVAQYSITSTNVPQLIPVTMAWAFDKMRRKVFNTNPETYGEWENMGSAVPDYSEPKPLPPQ